MLVYKCYVSECTYVYVLYFIRKCTYIYETKAIDIRVTLVHFISFNNVKLNENDRKKENVYTQLSYLIWMLCYKQAYIIKL